MKTGGWEKGYGTHGMHLVSCTCTLAPAFPQWAQLLLCLPVAFAISGESVTSSGETCASAPMPEAFKKQEATGSVGLGYSITSGVLQPPFSALLFGHLPPAAKKQLEGGVWGRPLRGGGGPGGVGQGPLQNVQTGELLPVYRDALLALGGVPPFIAPPFPSHGRCNRAVLCEGKARAIRWL